jgi:hypothetical protein
MEHVEKKRKGDQEEQETGKNKDHEDPNGDPDEDPDEDADEDPDEVPDENPYEYSDEDSDDNPDEYPDYDLPCLSDEVWVTIFAYLDHNVLEQVGQVSQRFFCLSRAPLLWTVLDLNLCLVKPPEFEALIERCTALKKLSIWTNKGQWKKNPFLTNFIADEGSSIPDQQIF